MANVKTINCLDQFLALFRGTTPESQIDDLIEYMVKSSYYVDPEKVQKRNEEISNIINNLVPKGSYVDSKGNTISNNEDWRRKTFYVQRPNSRERLKDNLLPVRWTSDLYIFDGNSYISVKDKNNSNKVDVTSKKQAREAQKEWTLYFKYNNNYYPVDVDSDGNDYVVNTIKKATGHSVSKGKQSTITNATISHIWGNATNPFYFTGLWNILIIPTFCNFILDKQEDSSDDDKYQNIINKVNKTFQAICYKMYNVNEITYLQDVGITIDKPEEEYIEAADKYIKLIPQDHILKSEP